MSEMVTHTHRDSHMEIKTTQRISLILHFFSVTKNKRQWLTTWGRCFQEERRAGSRAADRQGLGLQPGLLRTKRSIW